MLEIVIHQPGSPDGVAKLESGAYLVGSGTECHIASEGTFPALSDGRRTPRAIPRTRICVKRS